ncbi:thioesterase family protein [Micromonospora sp. WMMC415]|uniref:thioesterase family protein n=1 Tax=Micromonospora sp. WMMC415 TaxID=2675222 RepID=UPI0012B4AAF2|nr:thioesterase family protein [Micromonospora sp. WMMC415]QGN46022.1 thioesterase family protein [Micromonospora sp. WMMC415]
MTYEAFYEPAGAGRFRATAATAGPWDPAAQHAGPPSALLARALSAHEPVDGQLLSRVTVDILRPVPVAELALRVRTLRAGRRITLVEGVAEAGGQEVLHARGWRIIAPAERTPATPDDAPAVPGPDSGADPELWATAHTDGYLSSMQWRVVSGGFAEPGPARVWARPRIPLVPGEPVRPAELALLVADSGSGVSARLDLARWLFVNVDLTVTLHRPPRGEWLLLDSATTIGPHGSGVAASRLADLDGTVGEALQTLVVAPR